MTLSDFVASVSSSGGYATEAEAERITRTVLAEFGSRLGDEERSALADVLPPEARALLAAPATGADPLTAAQFVTAVAGCIDGATSATARWHVSTVLGVLGHVAGHRLTTRVLDCLPPGYALLFGRAELVQAA